jgi:NADPH2:quinone reductase
LLKWIGAKVIATVSSVETTQLLAENGADFVLNSKDEDIVTRVLEITERKGVAAVFDGVGKETFGMGLQVLARDGTMVTYGNMSGNVTGFDVDRLREKNLRLMRPRVFGYIRTREEFVGFAEKLFTYIGGTEGIRVAGGVYPLEDVARAHNDLEGRKAVGKLILKL